VQILGISENHTFSQKAFADSLKLPFPLLSDRALTVARAYGVLYGHTAGEIQYPHLVGRKAKRAFFLIDQQGIVREKWLGGDAEAFPNEKLLQAARVLAGKP
jgi:peroxiredoxin